ncbi:hypothetical protein [uncultured Selenomonas sp.]|uniref:hypothetical protein n=1 Tax=uncultured Selenomonas sp. TaxID=159275 RepID=UPI0028D121BD|nr:hypothetical protein [uncultured Selenomonas sp.]
MKHLFQAISCAALLLAALVFAGGTASAHTMPDSEWRLLFDAVGGDGAGVIEFGVGMPLQYAEDFLGSGFDEEEKAIESFRLVYYKYPGITFCGEMQKSDQRPPGEAPVVFIECRSAEFRTPSGFRVGDAFEEVEAMYGKGEVSGSKHVYCFDEARSVSFTVDEAGLIEEIGVHQVIFG